MQKEASKILYYRKSGDKHDFGAFCNSETDLRLLLVLNSIGFPDSVRFLSHFLLSAILTSERIISKCTASFEVMNSQHNSNAVKHSSIWLLFGTEVLC